MKDFQEDHLSICHKDKKLEAVFIHQKIDNEEQAKKYSNFVEDMRNILQEFVESSSFLNESYNKENNYKEYNKPAKND